VEALIALGSFEALTADRFAKIEALCAEKYNGSIFFAAVTFEELLSALPKDKVSKNLADVIDDFEGYLDETWLLPRWKHRLDVVNCGRTHTEIGKENVYLCPAKGGAYNHSRGKFFGMYRGKTVGKVALSRRSHRHDQTAAACARRTYRPTSRQTRARCPGQGRPSSRGHRGSCGRPPGTSAR
jgi:hypothetical protein